MAVKGSGTFLRFSEIASEFGDTAPHSMSEFVRGGSLVPQADANNSIRTATDGPMRFAHFYSAVNVIAVTASSATNVSAASLFGSNWTTDVPKELIIPSGVTLGATSTSNFALTIESNLAGTLTVKNSGSIQGAGGAAGANGGDAIDANASCIIINESSGQIYAGGGGGGTGGNGSYQSTTTLGPYGSTSSNYWRFEYSVAEDQRQYPFPNYMRLRFQNSQVFGGGGSASTTSKSAGGYLYLRGSLFSTSLHFDYYRISRQQTVTNNTTGGSGGVGQGYNQSAANGSAGGTNAGTGGNGGAFGASGSSGANGNVSNGASGGSAGRYINGISNVTLTNNGAVAGGTV